MWSIPEGDADSARDVCALLCSVRESCLRQALRDDSPNTYGVIRGGITFDDTPRVRCKRCRFPVARKSEGSTCDMCRHYDPCFAGCGRLVSKESPSWYCPHCKPDDYLEVEFDEDTIREIA